MRVTCHNIAVDAHRILIFCMIFWGRQLKMTLLLLRVANYLEKFCVFSGFSERSWIIRDNRHHHRRVTRRFLCDETIFCGKINSRVGHVN